MFIGSHLQKHLHVNIGNSEIGTQLRDQLNGLCFGATRVRGKGVEENGKNEDVQRVAFVLSVLPIFLPCRMLWFLSRTDRVVSAKRNPLSLVYCLCSLALLSCLYAAFRRARV